MMVPCYMRSAILSPHCDDAPLSLGAALLGRQLGDVQTHVIFSVSRFVRGGHGGRAADEITAIRKAEEQSAARLAGYSAVFWDLPDAFARTRLKKLTDIFDPLWEPSSDDIWPDVANMLGTHVLKNFDAVLVPLGCGNHIDHRIVRAVTLSGLKRLGLLERVVFFEDLPYAGYAQPHHVDDCVRQVALGLEPVILGKDFIATKQALLQCYPSQLTSRDLAAVACHATRVGGERVWVHRGCTSLLRDQAQARGN